MIFGYFVVIVVVIIIIIIKWNELATDIYLELSKVGTNEMKKNLIAQL